MTRLSSGGEGGQRLVPNNITWRDSDYETELSGMTDLRIRDPEFSWPPSCDCTADRLVRIVRMAGATSHLRMQTYSQCLL